MASALFLLAVLTSAVTFVTGDNYVRVCYYGSWAIYRDSPNNLMPGDIDVHLCTHVIFAFSKLDKNATHLSPVDHQDAHSMALITDLKQQNPDLKVMLSVGGWTLGSDPFIKLVSTQENMDAFATNTVSYLRNHNFDGLDLDWEYPAARGSKPDDKDNFITLIETLSEAFDNDPKVIHHKADRLLLTAAVGPTEWRVGQSYNITELVQYLDFIILMMYDFHGGWEDGVNAHSALYSDDDLSVDRLVKFWISEGATETDLVIGVPFYGQTFTLANITDQEPGSPHNGDGSTATAYYDICTLIQKHNYTPTRLDPERVPYLVHNDIWIGYEDVDSVKEKAHYITDNKLRGVAVWAIDLDDIAGTCGSGRFPLMQALYDVLTTAPQPIES